MIKNRKTVKGKLGSTRPKDTGFAGIARKQSRNKKTTTKSNRPTDARTKALRTALKEKQKVAGKVGKGSRANQAFLGGSARQTPKPKTKKTKRVIDTQKRGTPTKVAKVLRPGGIENPYMGPISGSRGKYKAGGKTSKYRMAGGGKTSKYRMAGGGKTSKYRMAGGGKTSKYRMAGGGKTSKYRMKGGGKTSKYMAKGGKTSKYMRRGGKVK